MTKTGAQELMMKTNKVPRTPFEVAIQALHDFTSPSNDPKDNFITSVDVTGMDNEVSDGSYIHPTPVFDGNISLSIHSQLPYPPCYTPSYFDL